MNIQSQIDDLNKKTSALKREMQNCEHVWGEVKFNPYTGKKEILTGLYEKHGIHRYPTTQFIDEKKDRSTRVCKKCGKAEHTEKKREIKQDVKTEPVF